MWTRLLAFLLGTFWLVMLGLLCWSEFGGRRHLGSGASLETIWNKMLTSPDASALAVMYEGEEIGWCKWAPAIIEAGAPSRGAADSRNLEGMVREVVGYQLTVEGAFSLPDDLSRYQFKFQLGLAEPRQWRDFNLRFNDQLTTIRLQSSAATRELAVQTEGAMQLDTRFSFNDLQNPGQLAGQLGGPLAAIALANLPFIPRGTNSPGTLGNLKWAAEHDWTRVLNERVRCYRLSTKILDRYEIIVLVSRVGEVLRITLPGGVTLINHADGQIM
jgi:hypothetical protein